MITGISQPEYVTRRVNNCHSRATHKVKITDETFVFMCEKCSGKLKVKELDDPNYKTNNVLTFSN